MLNGTRKVCAGDYEDFKASTLKMLENGMLPIGVIMEDVRDCTLRDFQDFLTDFHMDTGLELTGRFLLDHASGNLTVILEINRMKPDNGEKNLIQ